MKHFSPLWSLIPGAALIAGCGSQPKDKTSEHSPQKPNVVYLIADDLGIGDLSCYGATKVSTPNIDRLAGQGMRSLPTLMPLLPPALLPVSAC